MSQASLTPKSLSGDSGKDANFKLQHRMLELPEKLWERIWSWGSDRVNPIVVKEVRQSLKSKQFTISFGLTLIAAVSWTLIAISLMVPRIFYLPGGVQLLAGFFCILTLPLMVIIPFSTFRSLTAETEESTFELLSISALSANQIVFGKMASACVQILLYLSALAPCIVLTYLLRGVSLFAILFLLGLTVLFSISETALALLLAAVGRTRMVQNGMSVIVLAGLLFAFFGWLGLLIGEGFDEFSNPPREIYVVLFAITTIIALAISLVLHAAAAAIDFPSENHSTPLRLRVVALLTLVLFWSLVGIVAAEEAVGAVFLVWGVFIFLMILGALMTGEHGVISPRAQRGLPRTFFGRVFLTWLYPGAGLGYVVLVCIFAGYFITLGSLEIYYSMTISNWFGRNSILIVGYMLLCYLVIYLGVNRLLLMLVPRYLPGRMVGSVALLAVLLLFAHLLPLVTVYYFNDYREFDYGAHQAFNVLWSTIVAMDDVPVSGGMFTFSSEIGITILLITLCAIVIFGLNLMLSTRDVLMVRVAQPPRVREDDQEFTNAPQVVDPFAADA